MEKMIVEELRTVGFNPSYRGFRYLTEMILYLCQGDLTEEFNLRKCYIHTAIKFRTKQSSVKGSVNYVLNTLNSNDYTRKKLTDYTGYEYASEITVKKLVTSVIIKLVKKMG